MGILRRIKSYMIKTGGLLSLPGMLYRAKNPVEMEMTEEEATAILEQIRPNREGSPFHAAVADNDNLYDLSVVIPVYNGQSYLRDCLDSILKQETRYSIEVICVNDGSQDRSPEILEEYSQDSRVKVLNQENQGISAARNNGLAHARGTYVMLVDNDDLLAEGTIEAVLEIAFQQDADIVKTGHLVFTESRTIPVVESDYRFCPNGLGPELLTYNGFVWGCVIRRSLFKKVCFPVGFWYEDMITRLLLYRLCRRFIYLDQICYHYRMHGNNASKKVWSAKSMKALDQYFLLEEIRRHAADLGLEEDFWVWQLYLDECGSLLFHRLNDLDLKARQAAFSACGTLLRFSADQWNLSVLSRRKYILAKSLLNRDFTLWERLCKSKLI